MRFERIELHNHTRESDGELTVAELIQFAEAHDFRSLALTDHNTVSGHHKLTKVIDSGLSSLEWIFGMELTTYYGHILCLNLADHIPWSDIDRNRPEMLFQRIRDKGAIAGIAHPFAMGSPISNGCEWVMNITDYTTFDFIEIINNSRPFLQVNRPAIQWWQELVLKGFRLAATSGLDLHRPIETNGLFTTYLVNDESSQNRPLRERLHEAVVHQQTIVTRGPVFYAEWDEYEGQRQLLCYIDEAISHNDFSITNNHKLWVQLTTLEGDLVVPFDTPNQPLQLVPPIKPEHKAMVIKLYQNHVSPENLLAIAPPIWL